MCVQILFKDKNIFELSVIIENIFSNNATFLNACKLKEYSLIQTVLVFLNLNKNNLLFDCRKIFRISLYFFVRVRTHHNTEFVQHKQGQCSHNHT